MTIQVVVAVATNDVDIANVFGTVIRFWDRVFTFTSYIKRFTVDTSQDGNIGSVEDSIVEGTERGDPSVKRG